MAASVDFTAALRALEARLGHMPTGPGVYLLKDAHGRVIYVGKAKNLRARVRTYLRGGDERSQVRFLVGRLADVELLVTGNEKEALILENNLIKQYKPRYNIRLKDDKSYVSVKVTVRDPWPRVLVTRRLARDGSRYLGPFHDAGAVRDALDTVRKVFPLRTCSDTVFRNRSRPCIEYDIKRCLAPCVLPVDRAVYEEHLRQATLVIEGRSREVVSALNARMATAAADERFEEAARLRDRVRALERTQERQQVLSHGGSDQDVFGLFREGDAVEAQALFIRAGALVGHRSYAFERCELDDATLVAAVLTQFYQAQGNVPPGEILVPVSIEDAGVRGEYLGERSGRRVRIVTPQRGDKRRLVELATRNAEQSFHARRSESSRASAQVEALARRLRLATTPRRLECVDIATLQGRDTVGALVCFVDGCASKADYRRYRIRTVDGTDDFAAVREVLLRRFAGAVEERPDVLVIDGGAGQLGVARAVLDELGIEDVAVIGLAKERVVRDATASDVVRRPERIYVPGRKNPIVLRQNSGALFLLQRLRDEAHRFANEYHRRLRAKSQLASPLDAVEGVGPVLKRRLLRHFGSVAALRAADPGSLCDVPGVGPSLAEAIVASLASLSD